MIERIETLVIARVATNRRAMTVEAIAKDLYRFAPTSTSESTWTEQVGAAIEQLQQRGVLDDKRALAEPGELVRRIGKYAAKSWQQLVERVLPGLGLGISADDKTRFKGRDAWCAAIAGRALGLWTTGAPPSPAALLDGLAWQQIGLPGKPKRCPPEIRAVFLQRELGVEAGPPDRMLRLYAAKQVGAPRPELRALRDALVRSWLEGRVHGTQSFADEVRDVARATREGVFGDRKVFISSVWDELRRHPTWSALTLDEFKARLVRAHRDGDLVLARADLVSAMNPELVAASETTTDGASFHFIVRENLKEDAP